jgi:hypothetical protein
MRADESRSGANSEKVPIKRHIQNRSRTEWTYSYVLLCSRVELLKCPRRDGLCVDFRVARMQEHEEEGVEGGREGRMRAGRERGRKMGRGRVRARVERGKTGCIG